MTYLRIDDEKSYINKCSLVMAKLIVPPTKFVPIPRFELTAAALSINVSTMLRRELTIYPTIEEYFWTDSRFWHVRCAITHACLCTCLKQRCAKKSMPCLIRKASRRAADCMSKTATCFIYFIGSVVKTVLYLHFPYSKNGRLHQIKTKHE